MYLNKCVLVTLQEGYADVTAQPHGHFLSDLKQSTPEEYSFRTCVKTNELRLNWNINIFDEMFTREYVEYDGKRLAMLIVVKTSNSTIQ